VQVEHGQTAAQPGGPEDIAEAGVDVVHAGPAAVERDGGALTHIEGAQVVDAMGMVGVGMGIEHGVDVEQAIGHRLQTQFGRRVDQDRGIVVADHDGGTGAPVARVGRGTDRAVAPDHGHAMARAGAENGNLHRFSIAVGLPSTAERIRG